MDVLIVLVIVFVIIIIFIKQRKTKKYYINSRRGDLYDNIKFIKRDLPVSSYQCGGMKEFSSDREYEEAKSIVEKKYNTPTDDISDYEISELISHKNMYNLTTPDHLPLVGWTSS